MNDMISHVRVLSAGEVVEAQTRARDEFVARVNATTRLGRSESTAVSPAQLEAWWPRARSPSDEQSAT